MLRIFGGGKTLGLACALVWLSGCGGDDVGASGGGSSSGGASTGGSTGLMTGTTALPTSTDATTTAASTSGVVGETEMAPTTGTTMAPGECGDGVLDPGEACDDGPNNGPGQACTADCAANACGDGNLGPGEECDNGAMNGDMNGCKANCTNNVCGDGAVGPGEGCDDGNQVDNDDCTNYSSFPATVPTRQLTSKLHGRNRWVFPRPATGPPTASPRPCPPGLEKSWRRDLA